MKRKFLGLIIAFLSIYFLYNFPIQRHLAKVNIDKYIAEQGANVENVVSKRMFKDYKMNGYTVEIVYKDDPNYKYFYEYSKIYKNKKYKVFIGIYNKKNIEVSVTGEKVKYPPLPYLKEVD